MKGGKLLIAFGFAVILLSFGVALQWFCCICSAEVGPKSGDAVTAILLSGRKGIPVLHFLNVLILTADVVALFFSD